MQSFQILQCQLSVFKNRARNNLQQGAMHNVFAIYCTITLAPEVTKLGRKPKSKNGLISGIRSVKLTWSIFGSLGSVVTTAFNQQITSLNPV